MKILRLLRRQLNRQLALIHENKIQAAQDMGLHIEATIARLEADPPPENRTAHRLHAECAELNDLVLEHFEEDRAELAEGILKMQVEQQLSELRQDPPGNSGDKR